MSIASWGKNVMDNGMNGGVFVQLRRLWRPLSLLCIMTAVIWVVPYFIESERLINLCNNLCASFISAIVLIFFVDFYVSEIERKKIVDKENACFRSLTPEVHRLCDMYFNLLKATSSEIGSSKMGAVCILESIDFKVVIKMQRRISAPVYPEQSWVEYFADTHIEFAKAIGKFIEKYATFLDGSTIDLCERIVYSYVLFHCKAAKNHKSALPDFMHELGLESEHSLFLIIAGMGFDLCPGQEFLTDVSLLIKKVEIARGGALMLDVEWSENMAPKLGEALIV